MTDGEPALRPICMTASEGPRDGEPRAKRFGELPFCLRESHLVVVGIPELLIIG